MRQYYDLSEIEYKIMEMAWSTPKPLSFSEVMKFFNENINPIGRKQTVHTHLTRLVKKGVLLCDSTKARHLYSPAMSRDAFLQKWTAKLLDDSFGGSLERFVQACLGDDARLSARDASRLKEIIDQHTVR